MPGPARHIRETIEAVSIRYNNRVYDLKRAGVDVITLSLGEAFFQLPLFPWNTLPFPEAYHYSHSRGILELRQRVAELYRGSYGVASDPETEILVTAGSKAAIHLTFAALLDPGDEALLFEPYWVSYTEQIKLCHATPVTIPFGVEITETERYLTPRTRCIVLNNPNNPTGRVYTAEELKFLLELARKHDLYLLADEAYSDFVREPGEFVSLGVVDPGFKHTIITNSISKNFGISGWRIGYVLAGAELIRQIVKANQHVITCPPTVLQHYVAAHFRELQEVTRPQIRDVVEKRTAAAEYMHQIGLERAAGAATFYLFASIAGSRLRSEEFCDRLLRDFATAVVPGVGYGPSCDRYVRVSVGAESWERTTRGLDAVKRLVDLTAE